jgi:enoyl-CoA hydratase/carnithine racemase
VIDLEVHDDVHVVRLDKEPVNALDVEMLDALAGTLRNLEGPLVLTGNGRVFSAGVDLQRVLSEGADYAPRLIAEQLAALARRRQEKPPLTPFPS